MNKLALAMVSAACLLPGLGGTASAHACSSAGTKHAVVGGSHKCLKTGQFCARGKAAAYRRYGFRCTTGSDGRARLKRA